MRDWRSGPQYDHRTLGDLASAGYRIRVVCTFCRHLSHLSPSHLRYLQPARYAWRTIVPRLRCSCCGKKQVKVATERAAALSQLLPRALLTGRHRCG